jgi:hypothetical protein
MGCGVGDPPNAKTIYKKKKKYFSQIRNTELQIRMWKVK